MILGWHAPDSEAGHGYATVGKQLRDAVKRQGAIILPSDGFGWDAMVIVNPPNAAYMLGPHVRPDLVLHTMTETNAVPDAWVHILNRVGLVWVPSAFVAHTFRENGVQTPILRVGYGFDGVPVQREVRDDHLRILAWGDNLHSRKNIRTVIDSFIAADLPNASLEIKLNIGLGLPTLQWNDGTRTYGNITIYHDTWSRERLREWFEQGDLGIYLSAGEGYGLMPGEMMRSGLPMISVLHTGLTEYLTPDVMLVVPSTEQPSSFFNKRFHVTHATGFKPDFDAVVELIRYAAANRERVAALGMTGAKHLDSYTWDRVGKDAYAGLIQYYDHQH
jgi:glycosyltransferase involved in cell wall biosynthesis